MKKQFLIISVVLITLISAYAGYKWHKNQNCEKWFQLARSAFEDGYYAESIKQSTLYLSEDQCRGITDPDIITLLSKARLKVPLPDNSHLSAQLMITRMGMKLKDDEEQNITLARASLTTGRWADARHLVKDIKQTDAVRIAIAAALKLEDFQTAQQHFDDFMGSDTTQFDKAILLALIKSMQIQLSTKSVPKLDMEINALAMLITSATTNGDWKYLVNKHKSSLSDMDVKIAVSLAVMNGKSNLAIALLDQPDRQFPVTLLIKFSKLLWQKGDLRTIAKQLPNSKVKGRKTSPFLLIICLAQLDIAGECKVRYDVQHQARIEGLYVADRYNDLIYALQTLPMQPKAVIDALDNMGSLRAGLPVLDQFQAYVFKKNGEPAMAAWHINRAKIFGLKEKDYGIKFTDDLKILLEKYRAEGDLSRSQKTLLKKYSPNRSMNWRVLEAKGLLASGENSDMAKAMKLLSPLTKWAKGEFAPYMLLAVGYAHFKDETQTYLHLIKSVELNPSNIVQACRLALGMYEKKQIVDPKSLVNWWYVLSYVEMKKRVARDNLEGAKVYRERLYILADYASKNQDIPLYLATYEKLVELDPLNDIALNNLAYALFSIGKNLPRAKWLADKAKKINPKEKEYNKTFSDIVQAMERVG